jgi:hypothetical protein
MGLRHVLNAIVLILVSTIGIHVVVHALGPNRVLYGHWHIARPLGLRHLRHEPWELPTARLLWSLVDELLLRVNHVLVGHLAWLDRAWHLTLAHVLSHRWGRLPHVEIAWLVGLPPGEVYDGPALIDLDYTRGFLELALLALRRWGRCDIGAAQ